MCSAWLDIITGNDFVLQASQTNARCTGLSAGCMMMIFFFYRKCDEYKEMPLEKLKLTLNLPWSHQKKGDLSCQSGACIVVQQSIIVIIAHI